MKTAKPPEIIQNETNPQPVEIIADAIVEIGKAFKKLNDSRLTQDAIVTLLHRSCGYKVSRSDIEAVLENVTLLEKRWLKKKD